jgi:hypothetical protein
LPPLQNFIASPDRWLVTMGYLAWYLKIEVKRLITDRKRGQTRREDFAKFAPMSCAVRRRSRRSTRPYGGWTSYAGAATATTNRVTATAIDTLPSIKVVDRLADHSDPSAQSITLGEIVIDAKVGGDWRRALARSSVYQPL